MGWNRGSLHVAFMTRYDRPETEELADELLRRIETIVNEPRYQPIMAMMAGH